jgi:transposase
MRNITTKREVRLTDEQRQRLETLTRNGSASAKKIQHARVLLLSDIEHPAGGYRDDQIASILGIHRNTVAQVRTRFALQGEGPALNRKVRATPPRTPKLDGRAEATLVAICCSPPPEGRTRWTLQLLCQEMVARRIVASIGYETIRKTLKKTSCSLGGGSDSVSPSGRRPGSSRRWNKSWTPTRGR